MPPNPLRVLFMVQGEGRGHLSQALALRELLAGAGHRVVGLLVGGSERRPLPDYFARGMGLDPLSFPSPVTLPGRDRSGVSMSSTVAYNLRRLGAYREALARIRKAIFDAAPDLVVNFYDPLGGVAMKAPALRHIPLFAVGHQYLLGHAGAPRPPLRPLQLLPFHVINRLSAPPGTLRLALSFRELPDGPTHHTRVIPPLLRSSVLNAEPTGGDHILVYVLNDGYADAIARWHEGNTHIPIHGFWDRPGAPEEEEIRPNLVFHRLSDTRFLELMRSCRGYVGTAGFEAVAEALWLGKPVMVVPTGKQVEQAWNGREAEAAGAGIARDTFDLTPFLEYLPRHRDPSQVYRAWVRKGHDRILTLLEETASRRIRGPEPWSPSPP